jgi:2-oxoglutarate ferredoxin oxidoreductase subunit beta
MPDTPLPNDDGLPENAGQPPEPRGAKGARPDTPEPAGKRRPGGARPTPGAKPARPPGAKPARPTGAKPIRPPGAKPARPVPPPGSRLRPATLPAGDGAPVDLPVLTRKDFASDADVRWCPGCGDYAVLAAVQRTLPDLADTKENVVFVSGIGCSSRFPYYMDTYGVHSIHGRAPAFALGLKATRPDLDVWVITGDGDALSIGGNHLAHLLRRNLDVQLLLFNNQIYGLTKGQYSPTSEVGKVTKSSPYGSLDHPFNPAAFALGADATFVARTLDRDAKHLSRVIGEAHGHRGTAFVEVYQNCNIFNDGAFADFTDRATKAERSLFVEHGEPLLYDKGKRGVRLDGLRLQTFEVGADGSADDALVYDESDKLMAHAVVEQLFWDAAMPRPFGVLYRTQRPTYDQVFNEQLAAVREKKGPGDLGALLQGGATWTVV